MDTQLPDGTHSRWLYLAAPLLIVLGFLLFWNLGAYALWDDEANTALFALNVWRTGDTNAYDGNNIVAFREGLELVGLKNRVFPPLQYFFLAPFIGLLGHDSWGARVPFALVSFLGFWLWAFWLKKSSKAMAVLTSIFVFGNVSLFLFARQARYYSLAWVLAFLLVYLYFERRASFRNRILLCLTATALLACHYLSYGALMACLAVDYVAFEIWKKNDSWKERFFFLTTQLVALVGIVGVFFPFGKKVTDYVPASWWQDKATLFWWNLRDLNSCEFMFLPMIGLGLLVGLWKRDVWLIRGILALGVFAAMASILSPQPVGWASVSDIRYMSTTIPLGIFISARTLWVGLRDIPLQWPRNLLTYGLAMFLAFSNVAHAWFQDFVSAPTRLPIRSSISEWLYELTIPQRSAFGEVSTWLQQQGAEEKNVWVLPDFAVFPLMFHAPAHHYMWQFGPGKRQEYSMLPDSHFRFYGVPDVVVAFGPTVNSAREFVQQLSQRGMIYEQIRLDVVGPDATRPELFWRTFKTIVPAPHEGTYLFRRVKP